MPPNTAGAFSGSFFGSSWFHQSGVSSSCPPVTPAVEQPTERANMSKNENINNIIGTAACGLLVTFLATLVPYRIISSENHTVLPQLEPVRFLGPFLVLLGILGYLVCFSNFILDAKGTPLPLGTQKHLIVKGLYQYVRNPIYISWFLILLGEAFFFRSLDLLFYLLVWMVFFHFKVVFSEEPSLRNKFGASYEKYCRSVPRWIPRLKIAYGGSKQT
jgi:protein-S-isoprenylcysteine O-methyltransferase Ste14